MAGQTILIYGANYAPGHQDVISSYSRVLESHFQIVYCLNDSYYQGDPSFYADKPTFPLNAYEQWTGQQKDPFLVYIISPSKENIRATNTAKKHGAKVVYIYHEPYATIPQYYAKWGSSFKKIVKVCGLTYFNGRPFIKRLDGVILPSKNALAIFQRNFQGKRFQKKKTLCMPLLFSERTNPVSDNDKKYAISFIGNVDRIKNFDLFVDFLSNSAIKGRALIATGSRIDDDILRRFANRELTVEVHQGRRMSNEEIESYYQQSSAAWLFYKDSTQSGVLPMCYRHGVAAISSSAKGIAQDVVDGETGFILQKYSAGAVDDAIRQILERNNDFIGKTTAYFDSHFCYVNRVEEINSFFESLFGSED